MGTGRVLPGYCHSLHAMHSVPDYRVCSKYLEWQPFASGRVTIQNQSANSQSRRIQHLGGCTATTQSRIYSEQLSYGAGTDWWARNHQTGGYHGDQESLEKHEERVIIAGNDELCIYLCQVLLPMVMCDELR